MKVAFVTPEFQSLVRRTNLAEVAEYLPRTLHGQGVEVLVFLPFVGDIDTDMISDLTEAGSIEVQDDGAPTTVTIYRGRLADPTGGNGLPLVLLDHPKHFRGRHPYGDDHGPYPDNWRRYALFSRAVLESLEVLPFRPDVLHCMDWTTGLIPLIQELEYKKTKPDHNASHAGTYFAIHNFAMQGSFEREILPHVGLPHRLFRGIEGFELGGKVNFMKAGAEFATIVGTYSPSQAERIVEGDRGIGMEETFRRRNKELVGVLGGIDYQAWDPASDPLLNQNFSEKDKDLAGKRKCKVNLQAGLRLDNGPRTPLVTIIGRFDADSGFDILAEALTPMLERNIELVLMGPGQKDILDRLRTLEQTFTGRCRLIDSYQVPTAHTLLAGADCLLLPGHHHPSNVLCAIAMRYGVVPVVYSHSGLRDTVSNFVQDKRNATGFFFEHYNSKSLLEGIDEMRAVYKKPADWKRIVMRCLRQDFSWEESARNYVKAYRRVTRRARGR